ncbi:MAG TPA: hypothetical protein VEA41_03315, partial [Salinarimonas sp.]|nr:hypothetical protein [Salinarimonas sp.]
MVLSHEDIERVVEGWAGDPAVADLLRPGAAAILWLGERPIWASDAARPFAEALRLDEAGALEARSPAAARLRALGDGAAPRAGARLERLRFEPGGLAPPATLACRRVALPTGEEPLLTVFVGAVPRLSRRPGPAPALPAAPPPADEPPAAPEDSDGNAASWRDETPPGTAPAAPADPDALPVEAVPDLGLEAPDPAPEPIGPAPGDEAPADPLAGLRERGTVRFLWQADPQGRFLAVTAALAEIVGPVGADIVGRLWGELADRVEDPTGIVAEHFARGETWSSRTVLWRIDGTDHAVPVELAGIPLRDRGRTLQGFRGFGLVRTAGLVERPRPPAPAARATIADAPAQDREDPLASAPAELAHEVGENTGSADVEGGGPGASPPMAEDADREPAAAFLGQPLQGEAADGTPASVEPVTDGGAAVAESPAGMSGAQAARAVPTSSPEALPDPASDRASVEAEPPAEAERGDGAVAVEPVDAATLDEPEPVVETAADPTPAREDGAAVQAEADAATDRADGGHEAAEPGHAPALQGGFADLAARPGATFAPVWAAALAMSGPLPGQTEASEPELPEGVEPASSVPAEPTGEGPPEPPAGEALAEPDPEMAQAPAEAEIGEAAREPVETVVQEVDREVGQDAAQEPTQDADRAAAQEIAEAPMPATPARASAPSAASDAMLRLSASERSAFREIARALGARFDDEGAEEPAAAVAEASPPPAADPDPRVDELPA